MMPLAETGIVGQDAALATALVIGVLFGWLLERGGLAHAPKLAGQFYFTDLTVMKVLFTALITAMAGAHILDWAGVLDLGLVYMPETFVAPQAVGGVLFGAGFLLGGLCPGTSCVAAASGRLDGLGVIGGMLLGVLAFNVSFDRIERFYDSTPMGQVTVAEAWSAWRGREATPPSITATELAERIINRREGLRVFDLNSRVDFDRFHIPGATHATPKAIQSDPPAASTVVLYANNLSRATSAWSTVSGRVAEAYVLRGGLQEWFRTIYEPRLAVDATPAERAEFERVLPLSRFFGGRPRLDVPRDQLLAAAIIRRRGC